MSTAHAAGDAGSQHATPDAEDPAAPRQPAAPPPGKKSLTSMLPPHGLLAAAAAKKPPADAAHAGHDADPGGGKRSHAEMKRAPVEKHKRKRPAQAAAGQPAAEDPFGLHLAAKPGDKKDKKGPKVAADRGKAGPPPQVEGAGADPANASPFV